MNKRPTTSLIALVLAALSMAFASGLHAQQVSYFKSLAYNFGAFPLTLVQTSDGTFYGTAISGGDYGRGTIFSCSPQGTLGVSHHFGESKTSLPSPLDGALPAAGLVDDKQGHLFGTTSAGGTAGKGTVFYFDLDDFEEGVSHNFGDGSVANDGAIPLGGLIFDLNGDLIGTTSAGGSAGKGVIFEYTAQGAYKIVHSFGDGSVPNDGVAPTVGLAVDTAGNLYGTTPTGGAYNQGTVYKLDPQQHYSVLYSFRQHAKVAFNPDGLQGPSQGASCFPNSRLLVATDGNLYGTTAAAPGYGYGTVYQLTTEGVETDLHFFGDGTVPNDGQETSLPLEHGENILMQAPDGNIYGTTNVGGEFGHGTVFAMTTAGQLTVLRSFGDPGVTSDGSFPLGGIILGQDGNLYGTTSEGGAATLQAGVITTNDVGTGATLSLGSGGGGNNVVTILNIASGEGIITVTPAGGINLTFASGSAGIIEGSSATEVPNFLPPNLGSAACDGTIFKITPTLPAITSNTAVTAVAGNAFSYQIAATLSPLTYNATGLPTGLTVSGTGLISGTPTALGTSYVTISATNSVGTTSATLAINIVPPPIVTSLLSAFGTTSAPFAYQVTASANPTSFAAAGLPGGLSINSTTGMISGTPAATGTFAIMISAANIAGTGPSQTLNLTVTSTAPTPSQEYVLLYSFTGATDPNGVYPGMVISGMNGLIYGVTSAGATGSGAVFSLSPAGDINLFTNAAGANGAAPSSLAQADDGSFDGTTPASGNAYGGTAFQISPNGTVTTFYTFGYTPPGQLGQDQGIGPQGVPIISNGGIIGTTQGGGLFGAGTIYQASPLGSYVLHDFSPGAQNPDGGQPVAGLALGPNGLMYGTTLAGGTANDGTVFSIDSHGSYNIIHHFGVTANDGQLPHSALTFYNGNFYGTTVTGGTFSKGTIFEITPAGVETVLHNFGDGSVANDGINPIAGLLVTTDASGNVVFFGTTQGGGTAGQGTLFEMDTSSNLTIVHSFGDVGTPNDGQTPTSGVCLGRDGNLYGTTVGGGAGYGTVYAVATNFVAPANVVPPSYWTCSGNIPLGLTFNSATGTLTGTPLSGIATGAYTLSITHVTNGVAGAAQQVTVAITQTYANWASTHLSGPGDPGSAPTGDGIANLLKFAFDINPSGHLSAADLGALPSLGMVSDSGSDYLTLTYRQNITASGVTVVVQTSSDMKTWTTVSPPEYSQQVGTDATTGDPMMQVGVRMTSGVQFIRLNAVSQ